MTSTTPFTDHVPSSFPTAFPPRAPAKSALVRSFDAAALGAYRHLARAAGYVFRSGTGEDLRRDGRAVLRAAWAAKNVAPPSDLAHVADRYDAATTWFVAYHRGSAVGVLGLVDMRRASVALDYGNLRAPAWIDLDTTREIARLGIVPEHRGGAQLVMVGLLFEMLRWSKQNGIACLFAGSTEALFRVYRRFNPTARLLELEPAGPEHPDLTRYYAAMRAYGGPGVVYTFGVEGASPWDVFTRFLTGTLKSKEPS